VQEKFKTKITAERKTFIKSDIKDIQATGNEADLTHTMLILQEQVIIEKHGSLSTM
jgi:hypothetical protein